MFISRIIHPNPAVRTYRFPYRLVIKAVRGARPHYDRGICMGTYGAQGDQMFMQVRNLDQFAKRIQGDIIECINIADNELTVKLEEHGVLDERWKAVEAHMKNVFCLDIKKVSGV